MQDQAMQARLQAALDACTRMQEQRDQLAAQLKDATAQCGVMAELLYESIPYVEERADVAPSKQIAGYHETLVARMKEALAGKLPEPLQAKSPLLEALERQAEMLKRMEDRQSSTLVHAKYMQGAADFKQELIKATRVFIHPHIEGVFAVFQGRHGRALLTPTPERSIPDELPALVLERTAEAMGEAYDCNRSWSAWGYGTMGPNDFHLVGDDCDRVSEIAMAAITAWEESANQAGGGM